MLGNSFVWASSMSVTRIHAHTHTETSIHTCIHTDKQSCEWICMEKCTCDFTHIFNCQFYAAVICVDPCISPLAQILSTTRFPLLRRVAVSVGTSLLWSCTSFWTTAQFKTLFELFLHVKNNISKDGHAQSPALQNLFVFDTSSKSPIQDSYTFISPWSRIISAPSSNPYNLDTVSVKYHA